MIFTGLDFIVFFAVTLTVFYLTPHTLQRMVLLAANYVFYMWLDPVFGAFLVGATVVTYFAARAVDSSFWGLKKAWAAIGVCAVLCQLAVLKYADLALSGIGFLSGRQFDSLGLILPIGISFYTFASVGYIFDVYRGKYPAEGNFLDCALFLSFFPCIMSGPIPRGGELLPQFKHRHAFCGEGFRRGLLRFVWGMMKKMVVADSFAVMVNTAYAAPENFTSGQWLLCIAVYSLYIYIDFDAYTDMAVGCALMLGFVLPENFSTPYFSRTVQGFWKGWHMSLTGWFREYLYFPLGGSRKGKWRTVFNILIVFAVSGLWHGAALTFVVWGLLNGMYQVMGILTDNLRRTVKKHLHIKENSPLLYLGQMLIVFVLVSAAWIFFRADGIDQAVFIAKRILLIFRDGFGAGSVTDLGLSVQRLAVTVLFAVVLIVFDIAKAKKLTLPKLENKPWAYCISVAALVLVILVFGAYGQGFDQSEFIYFKF